MIRECLITGRRTSYGGSGTGHGHVAEDELLKLKKKGQFPDDLFELFIMNRETETEVVRIEVVYY